MGLKEAPKHVRYNTPTAGVTAKGSGQSKAPLTLPHRHKLDTELCRAQHLIPQHAGRYMGEQGAAAVCDGQRRAPGRSAWQTDSAL